MREIRSAPIIVQNVVNYNAVIAVNNPELKFKPGMTATVSILVAQRDKVLKIPKAALRFQPKLTPQEREQFNGLPEAATAVLRWSRAKPSASAGKARPRSGC